MIPLTDEEKKIRREQKVCYIWKNRFSTDDNHDNKKYYKVRYHCHFTGEYRGAVHDICNLRNKIPKEIHVVFHNGSTSDYHFILKELAEGFEGQFQCLGENTEKYITFSVPIKKQLDNGKTIIYKIRFINVLSGLYLGNYHDLYVQSDTLSLPDVFDSFRNKCIEKYELDPAHFLSAPGLA